MPRESRLDPAFVAQLRTQAITDPHGAYDTAASALADHPAQIGLRQIQASALIQTGSLRAAREMIEALYAEGHRDAETLGLLGSVWKRRADAARSPGDRQHALGKARDAYLEGLGQAETDGDTEGYYPGINAAALTLFLGDEAKACEFAARATSLAERKQDEDYWVLATKAEAALIRRDRATARALYEAAAKCRPGYSHVATTRRQARMIATALGWDAAVVDDSLAVPPVLVFVGHMTDGLARPGPRFPEQMTGEIAERMKAAIGRSGAAAGFSSAARGGDLLFLEALGAAGIEQRVVLPLEKEPFMSTSVIGGNSKWSEKFADALARAKSVHIANSHSATADGAAFEYGTRILLGLARLHARRLDTELRALVLWEGAPGDGHGGTAWAVAHLHECGVPVENIYPVRDGSMAWEPKDAAAVHTTNRPIHAMLFADCKGYSKLREEKVAEFTEGFLSGVARLIEHLRGDGCAPIMANTWGDGIFMVFESVRAAGVFATALRDGLLQREGAPVFPKDIVVRIGLHAGPVTPFFDPVIQRQNFAGHNVAFAARIEPIAAENQIYVSEAFAALAAERGLDEFQFDYLGETRLGKDFGQFRLYQLQSTAYRP